MSKENYRVRLNRPDGVSKSEMREYIVDAIAKWEDSIFYDVSVYNLNYRVETISRSEGEGRGDEWYTDWYRCPTCKEYCIPGNADGQKTKFCMYCGTKIIWKK